MASSAGTGGAACSYSSRSGSYAAVAAHELTRQRSVPASLAAAFASCGGGGGGHVWPRSLGDEDGDGRQFRGRAPAPGGVAGAVVRAVWAWIGRRGRKAAVLVRSVSSSAAKEYAQYGHEEYAENFDEGAAAKEPENLSRSFSARYARRAPWDGAR